MLVVQALEMAALTRSQADAMLATPVKREVVEVLLIIL